MTQAMHRVLIVRDDRTVQDALRPLFESCGFRVVTCNRARLTRNDARLHRSDVVLLDLARPDREGLGVIHAIRSCTPVPVIVLSAHAAEADRVAAFELGADDYVVRPFSPAELMARVRAAMRRYVRGGLPMGLLQLGKVSIDLGSRTARRSDGSEVRLTPLEHRILETLVRHGDRIVSRSTLLKEVWGPHREDASQALRVYIGHLRRKLGEEPGRPRYIITESGMGYRLVLDAASAGKGGAARP
jgi:two-component system KDP operon response regulator KdpE